MTAKRILCIEQCGRTSAPFRLTPSPSLREREHARQRPGEADTPKNIESLTSLPPLPEGLPLPTSSSAASQSQRDCVLQPRVASSELPWVNWARWRQPQRGCDLRSSLDAATPLGLAAVWTPFSQGSSRLATLGFETESPWDSPARRYDLWGMPSPHGEGWGEGEGNIRLPSRKPTKPTQ
jgi:hypothetical protein